jgi:hypothetical protein
MSGSSNGNGNGKAAAALSDDLIERAKAIASRSDELLHLLEDARLRLLDPDEKQAKQRRFKPESDSRTAQKTNSKPATRTKRSAKNDGISEGLRLLTTQMSVSGASRNEIAARLRDEFGITDAEPILKDMGL